MLVELVDFDTATWSPSVSGAGVDAASTEGLLLARKAAVDLAVDVGDTVLLRHPVRGPDGGFAFAESEFPVAGIHGNPIRNFVYGDLSQAERFGLVGATNVVHAYPAEAAERGDLQYDIFELDGVTSSQAVARVSEVFDEALEQFVGFLVVAAVAVLILALLIAFNATRITVEERQREHATMRAYGLPVRSVMGVVIKESVVVGIAATAIGVAAGVVFLGWMLQSLAARTLPDLGIDLYLAPSTIVIALIVRCRRRLAGPALPDPPAAQDEHSRHAAGDGVGGAAGRRFAGRLLGSQRCREAFAPISRGGSPSWSCPTCRSPSVIARIVLVVLVLAFAVSSMTFSIFLPWDLPPDRWRSWCCPGCRLRRRPRHAPGAEGDRS